MTPRRPNILFFHIDNISSGDLGCYGGAYPIGATTPNIDRFAADARQLTNYNVEAQCTPTRSALMTGRHSVRTGCTSVVGDTGIVRWEVSIARQLEQLGYRNAIMGKWHIGRSEGRYPTDHGFHYWYGIGGTWDECLWADDPWFRKAELEPEQVLESTGPGHVESVKVLDTDVRRDIDLDFLERGIDWMRASKETGEPFFLYFNHSNIHFPTVPRAEFKDSSEGGALADCVQMLDADFGRLLAAVDELGIADDTIIVLAGDNGRDTSFHAPNDQGGGGNWRGGYFSTYEGNNRTPCIVRWPGHVETGVSDEMMHVVDWYPTLLNMLDAADLIPKDRELDGVDQSAFLAGESDASAREHFMMFFDDQLVGMRWRNFKVLTHKVENGAAPVQQLATPHVYNLTVNPDESTPYNYEFVHTWVLYKVFGPRAMAFQQSLAKDHVPKGAPVDFVPEHAR